jgi:hypothetical protein
MLEVPKEKRKESGIVPREEVIDIFIHVHHLRITFQPYSAYRPNKILAYQSIHSLLPPRPLPTRINQLTSISFFNFAKPTLFAFCAAVSSPSSAVSTASANISIRAKLFILSLPHPPFALIQHRLPCTRPRKVRQLICLESQEHERDLNCAGR